MFSPAMSSSTSGGSAFFASTECLSLSTFGSLASGDFSREDISNSQHQSVTSGLDGSSSGAGSRHNAVSNNGSLLEGVPSASTSRRPSTSQSYRNTSNRSSMTVQDPDYYPNPSKSLQHGHSLVEQTIVLPRRSGPSPAKRRKSEPEPEEFRGPKSAVGLGLISSPHLEGGGEGETSRASTPSRPRVRRTASNPEGMNADFAGLGLDFEDAERRSLTPPPVPSLPEEYRRTQAKLLGQTLSPRTNMGVETATAAHRSAIKTRSNLVRTENRVSVSNDPGQPSPSNDGTFFASSLLMALENSPDLKAIVENKLGIGKKELQSMVGGLAGVYDNWKAGLEVRMSKVSLEEKEEGDAEGGPGGDIRAGSGVSVLAIMMLYFD